MRQNGNLNHLVEPSLQGINRLALSFENNAQRISKKRYYLPNVEIKYYNVMIDGRHFFDLPAKNDKITSEKLLLVKEMIAQLVVY